MTGISSMTGFGRSEGSVGGTGWVWELRSVNGRGLEVRLRLPPGLDGLEAGLREAAGRVLRRGVAVDPELLAELLRLTMEVAAQIPGALPPRPEALLALPGVLRAAVDEGPGAALLEPVQAGFAAALAGLVAARQAEGGRLQVLLSGQLDEIASLRARAGEQAAEQPERQRARMLESLQGLLRDQPGLPAERIAQEVALLATRSDVREELDRLGAHLEAARALLGEDEAVGRRFDFLVQEFVRETNTLCSKSATTALTATGLRLKAAIEQMREQVQNVE